MAYTHHGTSLAGLVRGPNPSISRPAGQFDVIGETYSCDQTYLPTAWDELAQDTPHPDYPTMYVRDVRLVNSAARIARIKVTYLGLLSGRSKPPVITQRTGEVDQTINNVGGSGIARTFYSGYCDLHITRKYVTDQQPIPDYFFRDDSRQELADFFNNYFPGWLEFDPVELTAQDWRQAGNIYEVTHQYKQRITKY